MRTVIVIKIATKAKLMIPPTIEDWASSLLKWSGVRYFPKEMNLMRLANLDRKVLPLLVDLLDFSSIKLESILKLLTILIIITY